eukprot:7831136-Alexandrium_andersonii.AAC.1
MAKPAADVGPLSASFVSRSVLVQEGCVQLSALRDAVPALRQADMRMRLSWGKRAVSYTHLRAHETSAHL